MSVSFPTLSLYNYINGLSIYLIARPHEYLHDDNVSLSLPLSPRSNGNRPILLSTRNSFSSCLFLFWRFFSRSRPGEMKRTSFYFVKIEKRFLMSAPDISTLVHTIIILYVYLHSAAADLFTIPWLLFWLIFTFHKESQWKREKKTHKSRDFQTVHKMHKFKYEMQSQTHTHWKLMEWILNQMMGQTKLNQRIEWMNGRLTEWMKE